MAVCRLISLAVLTGTITWSASAWAGSVAAIVEEIEAEGTGVSFMDYLSAGRKIALGNHGRLIVGYLNSCLREVIVGGTVTIGSGKSVVEGGKIRRKRVECDGGRLLLTPEEAGKSAVVVFRNDKHQKRAGSLPPSLRIFSLQPVIQVRSDIATVTVERLDRRQPAITLKFRNGVADFAKRDLSLERGGLYRVTSNGAARIIKVDPHAVKGGAVISRLVAL